MGCPSCSVLAAGHGCRRPAARPALRRSAGAVSWRKRIHRCRKDACEVTTFSEVHELAAPRGKLTTHAIAWAVTQQRSHDIAVSALADVLGVAWNTVWDAVVPVIKDQLAA